MAEVTIGAVVLADGFDLSCYLTSVEFKADQDIKDNTTLCNTGARTFQPGLVDRGVSGEGFYAQNAVNDALSIQKTFDDAFSSTANKLITIGSKGATQGYPALMLNTKQANANATVKVGELIMTKFDAKATLDGSVAAFAYGIWLYSATVTGSVNGATYDNLAATAGWFIQAHNTDADGTATFKVQHSVDGSTWVDLATFTALAANSASQNVSTGSTLRRYLRVTMTAIGGTTNKISVAIKPGYTGS